MATMAPVRWTARPRGASLPKAKCVCGPHCSTQHKKGFAAVRLAEDQHAVQATWEAPVHPEPSLFITRCPERAAWVSSSHQLEQESNRPGSGLLRFHGNPGINRGSLIAATARRAQNFYATTDRGPLSCTVREPCRRITREFGQRLSAAR